MNIFKHELRSQYRSMAIWAIAFSGLIILFMTLYPAFAKDVASTKKIFESLPAAFREALSISLDIFFSIFGFYVYILSFVILAGAIFAMNLGVISLSKEEHGKTADFLLTKPITRNTILNTKLLANLFSITVVDICFFISALLIAKMVSSEPFSTKTFFLVTFILFLVQLVFLALGTLVSCIVPKIKSPISISLPVVFAFFIINMLGSVLGDNAVRYITPFKFFDPIYVVSHNSYETRFLVLEAVVVAVAVTLSYLIYNRKDIQAAS